MNYASLQYMKSIVIILALMGWSVAASADEARSHSIPEPALLGEQSAESSRALSTKLYAAKVLATLCTPATSNAIIGWINLALADYETKIYYDKKSLTYSIARDSDHENNFVKIHEIFHVTFSPDGKQILGLVQHSRTSDLNQAHLVTKNKFVAQTCVVPPPAESAPSRNLVHAEANRSNP